MRNCWLALLLYLANAAASGADGYAPFGFQGGYSLFGAESATEQRPRSVLFFTATWCGPCLNAKQELRAWMEPSGWTFHETEPAYVQIVDCDKRPDLVARYGVRTIPHFVLIAADGRKLRESGYSDRRTIERLWGQL